MAVRRLPQLETIHPWEDTKLHEVATVLQHRDRQYHNVRRSDECNSQLLQALQADECN
jgi:hypothetical protein